MGIIVTRLNPLKNVSMTSSPSKQVKSSIIQRVTKLWPFYHEKEIKDLFDKVETLNSLVLEKQDGINSVLQELKEGIPTYETILYNKPNPKL